MRLRCVLGHRPDCEHYCLDTGIPRCKSPYIEARVDDMEQVCARFERKIKSETKWGPCDICETTLENWNEGALCSSCYNLLYVATGSMTAERKALKALAVRVKENYTMKSNCHQSHLMV